MELDNLSTAAKELFITTSWDDGHPLDTRLAELLVKHGLPATFYVPMRTFRGVMSPAELRRLSALFEIGGHTRNHRDLRTLPPVVSRNEIKHSKDFIEQITSLPCRSFCFPLGRFRSKHLEEVRDAGFTLARTVELMSLDTPRLVKGLWLMPTTMQAESIGIPAHVKNILKRRRAGNLLHYSRTRKGSWLATLESILELAIKRGGVVHLWGHSWEIEQNSDWETLDQAFSMLAQYKTVANFVSNGEIPDRIGPPALRPARQDSNRVYSRGLNSSE
jgi:peptidoglycan/xylan/chitin deacetylase (PgdA/CDA1 family)